MLNESNAGTTGVSSSNDPVGEGYAERHRNAMFSLIAATSVSVAVFGFCAARVFSSPKPMFVSASPLALSGFFVSLALAFVFITGIMLLCVKMHSIDKERRRNAVLVESLSIESRGATSGGSTTEYHSNEVLAPRACSDDAYEESGPSIDLGAVLVASLAGTSLVVAVTSFGVFYKDGFYDAIQSIFAPKIGAAQQICLVAALIFLVSTLVIAMIMCVRCANSKCCKPAQEEEFTILDYPQPMSGAASSRETQEERNQEKGDNNMDSASLDHVAAVEPGPSHASCSSKVSCHS